MLWSAKQSVWLSEGACTDQSAGFGVEGGGITVSVDVYPPTKWGHYPTNHGDHTLGVVITDEAEVQIFPATPLDWGFYQLPGFNSHSPYVVFNTGSRKVREGEVLRIWYGEDLINFGEHNNDGTVCVTVYGKLCGI